MAQPEVQKSEIRNSQSDAVLCRSALYEALALGFHRPTEETLARLVSPDAVAALADAAAIIDDGLAAAVHRLAGGHGLDDLSSTFYRVFGHTVRGPACPFETEYGNEALFQQPQELSDLAGFLRAFGLTANLVEHERVDHVSCECEFLMFLAYKEAYALDRGDAVMLEETRKAQRLFLRDHLGRFAPAFTKKLRREDRGGFYAALGALLLAFVTLECERVGVAVGSRGLGLRPEAPACVPMACGSGAEVPGMPGGCGAAGTE